MPKGPAPKGEYVGKSSVFSTRIRPDLKESLEKAAKKSGRSLSQEVEHRLRRSFVEDDKIADAFGDRRTFRIMRMMADAVTLLREQPWATGHWLDDPRDFEVAVMTMVGLLDAVRPKDIDEPYPSRWLVKTDATSVASGLWEAVKRARVGIDPRLSRFEQRMSIAKEDLGPVADRADLDVIKALFDGVDDK